jgi:N,N'-diacetylchitobiose phosphorylase
MRYGYFDDAAKEYVIDRPDTPKSWTNYLGDTTYGAIITNNAGGYSFFRSGAIGRFLRFKTNGVPMDQPGRFVYLRDRADGDFWSASWQPVGKPLDQYRSTCRFGTGYAIFDSTYRDITSRMTCFVPLGAHHEVWRVDLTNTGNTPRKLSLFTYCEFASSWNMAQDQVNLQYTQYIVDCNYRDGIIERGQNVHLAEDPSDFTNDDQSRWNWITLAGAEVASFDTDRDAFIGAYHSYANPVSVVNGRCGGTEAMGDNACGSLHADIDLAPGETRTVIVLLGVGRRAAGAKARAAFADAAACDAALAQVTARWHARLGAMTTQSADPLFDSFLNVWNPYNCLITLNWSRAASLVYNGERDGLGYRDSVQDVMAASLLDTDLAQQRLNLLLSGQESRGNAMPVVAPFRHHPGSEKPTDPHRIRSDDCLWLSDSVLNHVKETGDTAYLDSVVPYADAGEATVLGHLRRAIEFTLAHRGAHNLPCGLDADWNDCLRMGYRGESVFVAFQLRHALAGYIEACSRLDRAAEIAWAKPLLAEADAAIATHCWDGEWFVRAFTEGGEVIGTSRAKEGRIFLNTQSWAVISGYDRGDRGRGAMDAAHRLLGSEHGLHLCAPPFATVPCKEIRAVLFAPGTKENGGIFSQPQPWAVMAECLLGRPEQAWKAWRAFSPAHYNDRAEIRQIEPYVHCQSTHGKPSRRHGNGRLSWLTGTATWAYVAATQHLLGVKPDWDGLRISPCLEPLQKRLTIHRRFRGRDFAIRIANGVRGSGVIGLKLNGQELPGDLIPINRCTDRNTVDVQLA